MTTQDQGVVEAVVRATGHPPPVIQDIINALTSAGFTVVRTEHVQLAAAFLRTSEESYFSDENDNDKSLTNQELAKVFYAALGQKGEMDEG